MKTLSKRLSILLFILMFLTAGCNLPAIPGGLSPNDQAATIVAQTLQAAGGHPAPLSSATASTATLTLTDNTNCRKGPGVNYLRVSTIPKGTSATIVGRDETGRYFLVKAPGAAEACWVPGEFGTISGDAQSLPQVTPSVEKASGVPARPVYFFYQYECPAGNLTTILTWSDSSNNETGFRIYRYDVLIAELPANSTSYTDVTYVPPGSSITYGVTAFNDAGESALRTESFNCQ